jgi:Tannase and feruloyl esterase
MRSSASHIPKKSMIRSAALALALPLIGIQPASAQSSEQNSKQDISPTPLAAICHATFLQRRMPVGVTIRNIPNISTYVQKPLHAIKGGTLLVDANALGNGAPAYCFITGTMVTNTETGKTMNFGAYLPAADKWNGKFLQMGCGGTCGSVFEGGAANPAHISAGFAIWANDGGHIDGSIAKVGVSWAADASWAIRSPGVRDKDAIDDYLFRADHVMAVAGKQATAAIYSKPKVNRSYFLGCSHGGHEAMTEAARFPEDHDGIVAYAPYQPVTSSINFAARSLGQLRSIGAGLSSSQILAISKRARASCDPLDGVRDGIVQNANACHFDLAKDAPLCAPGKTGADCLTKEQVRSLSVIFNAVRDSDGNIVAAGWPAVSLGTGEFFAIPSPKTISSNDVLGPEPWVNSFHEWSLGNYTVMNFVYGGAADYNGTSTLGYRFGYGDPKDPNNYRATIPSRTVQKFHAALDDGQWTVHPLDDFLRRGNKIIMAHGLADMYLNAENTISFYRELAASLGGYEQVKDNVRLFLAPDVEHCGGGDGPDGFVSLYNTDEYPSPKIPFDADHDLLAAVIAWVEEGKAPSSIIASKYDLNKQLVRTMPLCPFPAMARYNGSGPVNDAASWSCTAGDVGMLEMGSSGNIAGMTSTAK